MQAPNAFFRRCQGCCNGLSTVVDRDDLRQEVQTTQQQYHDEGIDMVFAVGESIGVSAKVST